jgi:hypothetical protein
VSFVGFVSLVGFVWFGFVSLVGSVVSVSFVWWVSRS